jgi:hypothetical protein
MGGAGGLIIASSAYLFPPTSGIVSILAFGVLVLAVLFPLIRRIVVHISCGIAGADLRTNSGIDYRQSLRMATDGFEFLGFAGGKLVELAPDFEKAMERCHKQGHPIRFLLCPPDNRLFIEAAKRAGKTDEREFEKIAIKSLKKIAELKNQRQFNIDVRFYSAPTEADMPEFRLLFLNGSFLLVGYYIFGENRDRELPQMLLSKDRVRGEKSSFYYPFRMYFDSLWKRSAPWDFKQFI